MPTNNPMSSICERLTRTVPNTVNGRGTGLPDKLVNPDGPEAAAIISKLVDALESIREHVAVQPSALAKAIEATCDNALSLVASPLDGGGM